MVTLEYSLTIHLRRDDACIGGYGDGEKTRSFGHILDVDSSYEYPRYKTTK